MKKVLLILGAVFGGFVVVIAGIIFLVFEVTSAMPEAADRFFAAVRTNDMAAARAELSEEFRASTDTASLQQYLKSNGLADVVETEWNSRKFENKRGELEGSVLTADGGRIPLTMVFVEENEAWKILAISRSAAGVSQTQQGKLAIPALAERTALVKRSMHDFAMALEQGDMSSFYPTLSALWRSQTSVEELNTAFAVFFEQDIKLLSLDAMQPQFGTEASIDENGVLSIQGHYDTQPSVVHFNHRYILEGTDWRLLGINVQLKPVEVEE